MTAGLKETLREIGRTGLVGWGFDEGDGEGMWGRWLGGGGGGGKGG